jgi:GntR family transcriptional regulator
MYTPPDDWTIEFQSGIPAYKQIMHHVQAAVSQGQLSEGDQLPTIRALHLKLDVNPNTVAKAYRELEASGLIETTQGRGCFVAPAVPTPKLSLKEKRTKLSELVARFVAEANSQGIPFDELLHHLNTRKSHA